jgi:hypothetical protein
MMLSTKEAYCLFFNLGILGILAHFRHLESDSCILPSGLNVEKIWWSFIFKYIINTKIVSY